MTSPSPIQLAASLGWVDGGKGWAVYITQGISGFEMAEKHTSCSWVGGG